MKNKPIVRYLDRTIPVDCPYGDVRRIISGGEGCANVHLVRVAKGAGHFHRAYHEVYFFLSGTGTITLEDKVYPIKPGAVVNIPAGIVHSLISDTQTPLEFVIFGSPPMSIDDDRAAPVKP